MKDEKESTGQCRSSVTSFILHPSSFILHLFLNAMDSNALSGLVGICIGGAATLYNLMTLRRLGLSEAHQQLEALQQAALALQKDETARWKAAYELAEQKAAEQDRKITEQRALIEANCKEIEGLKMLIAQQAITQNFILREVVRRPELRAELEQSWTQMQAVLSSEG